MDNLSEYLVVFNNGQGRRAVLLDAKFGRIAEYNADADEVKQLLENAKALGKLSDSDREKMLSGLGEKARAQAVGYRLHE